MQLSTGSLLPLSWAHSLLWVQLRAMSPIHNLDRIRAPMLVLHGKEDERTPFKGAVEFVEAAEKAGKDLEYHWYAREGHGNARLENRMDAWRRVEAFLTRVMTDSE